jgi:hypothetical protein
MIASGEIPSYSLLVGIDYTESPVREIGERGISISAFPLIGPSITNISPAKFEAGSDVTMYGGNLNLPGLRVHIGSVEIPATPLGPNGLRFIIDKDIVKGDVISAGSHALSVVQTLPNGKQRSSNLMIGNLIPSVIDVTTDALQKVDPADPNSKVFGNIIGTGQFLGTSEDDIFIGLYRDGKTVKVFGEPSIIPITNPTHPQTQTRLEIGQKDAILPGVYNIIFSVNGQQARNSPQLEIVVP